MLKHRAQGGMGGGVVAGTDVGQTALGHDHDLIGAQGKVDLMQHAHHRAALGHQRAHQPQPIGLMRGIEVGQRLVHQQHLRLHRQRPRQQHTLALTARELAQWLAGPVPRLGVAQGLFHDGMILRTRRAQPPLVRQATQHHHVVGRQIVRARIHARPALPQPRHGLRPLAVAPARPVLAQQAHRARVRQQARHAAQQRRFARPIRANHRPPLPLRDAEMEIVQDRRATQLGTEGLDVQSGCGGGWGACHGAIPCCFSVVQRVLRCISHSK